MIDIIYYIRCYIYIYIYIYIKHIYIIIQYILYMGGWMEGRIIYIYIYIYIYNMYYRPILIPALTLIRTLSFKFDPNADS